ncbi:hypothetical protein LX15_001014 [Streptoalloteichus tenebrarius]|uniref:Uncharacterized protein n=1 Tax=Streptoalloteichus tenebrarius (strain ATCC 17920 / DSM 40477 / JCM 4838 / CBS 697.72 / NBRC 16177 / NCIMB 11028 / NRRL B-12390 / A12253. 1 / ISP 5477) TaxID=1933 RepID=A0ABT1HP85_STRSD|nr:hypothetical protein [Streptoalloteichus tenebrarius]
MSRSAVPVARPRGAPAGDGAAPKRPVPADATHHPDPPTLVR